MGTYWCALGAPWLTFLSVACALGAVGGAPSASKLLGAVGYAPGIALVARPPQSRAAAMRDWVLLLIGIVGFTQGGMSMLRWAWLCLGVVSTALAEFPWVRRYLTDDAQMVWGSGAAYMLDAVGATASAMGLRLWLKVSYVAEVTSRLDEDWHRLPSVMAAGVATIGVLVATGLAVRNRVSTTSGPVIAVTAAPLIRPSEVARKDPIGWGSLWREHVREVLGDPSTEFTPIDQKGVGEARLEAKAAFDRTLHTRDPANVRERVLAQTYMLVVRSREDPTLDAMGQCLVIKGNVALTARHVFKGQGPWVVHVQPRTGLEEFRRATTTVKEGFGLCSLVCPLGKSDACLVSLSVPPGRDLTGLLCVTIPASLWVTATPVCWTTGTRGATTGFCTFHDDSLTGGLDRGTSKTDVGDWVGVWLRSRGEAVRPTDSGGPILVQTSTTWALGGLIHGRSKAGDTALFQLVTQDMVQVGLRALSEK